MCPWSLPAWQQGRIDIVKTKTIRPLGNYTARIYILDLTRRRLKKLCKLRDHGVDEWLWSEPSNGRYAAPVACLIQQDRATLTRLRNKSGSESS
jgi:hypothetical protein